MARLRLALVLFLALILSPLAPFAESQQGCQTNCWDGTFIEWNQQCMQNGDPGDCTGCIVVCPDPGGDDDDCQSGGFCSASCMSCHGPVY